VVHHWYGKNTILNSNKSPTWCNNFSVYYPDVCLQLNTFRASSRPSSRAQWLQWQPLVLPSYRGDSRAVFVVEHVINVGIINWKIVASGLWTIWIVRWCIDLQTLNTILTKIKLNLSYSKLTAKTIKSNKRHNNC
jgi:hypothetical protein